VVNANVFLDCFDSGFWRARIVGLVVPTSPRVADF
jgi:hypothetical protein